MTLAETLATAYGWLDERALALLCGAVLFAATGTTAAWLSRRARRDGAGRYVAGVTIGVAAAALGLELLIVAVAWLAFDASVLDANVLLLLAPVLGLAASMFGIHLVFPLNQLASVRALLDIVWFALAGAATLWLLSTFRGWGILFGGGLLELAVIGGLGFVALRRLYRRAFGGRR